MRCSILSATSLVNARESPRSNKLKYPITTHARLIIPSRSVPRPCFSMGRHTTATTTGKQLPNRFHRVLPARDRPLGITTSNDVVSGSRFSDAKEISSGIVFILCPGFAMKQQFDSFRRFPSLQSPFLPAPFLSQVRRTWCGEPNQVFLWPWRHCLTSFQLPLVENSGDQLPRYTHRLRRQRQLHPDLSLPSEGRAPAFALRRKQNRGRNAASQWRSHNPQGRPVAA